MYRYALHNMVKMFRKKVHMVLIIGAVIIIVRFNRSLHVTEQTINTVFVHERYVGRPQNATNRNCKLIYFHKRTEHTLVRAILQESSDLGLLCLHERNPGLPVQGLSDNLPQAVFAAKTLPHPSQEDIDYIAKYLTVKFDVIDNFGSDFFVGDYTFINSGNRPIPAKRWQLYFYSMRLVENGEYPYPYGFYLKKCGLKLFHFSGQLYWLEPVADVFKDILPSSTVTCTIKHYNTQVARSDSMPNWYIVGNDLVPKIISSTRGEDLSYVGEFLRPSQYQRTPDEPDHPYSPAERYDIYRASAEKMTDQHILPTPLSITMNDKKTFEWDPSIWVVLSDGPFPAEAQYLAEKLKLRQITGKAPQKYVEFVKKYVDVSMYDAIKDEAYSLTIDPEKLVIYVAAATPEGAFYAVQSLISLVFTPRGGQGIRQVIPSFSVTDAPRYSYRGLHVDVARNFHGPDELKKMMEAMAMYKMNKLHLHLTDDEGWRLEIPGMPELIQIGSRRCHDPDEEQCIMPMLGSGPFANTSGTGYFDVGSYKDLLHFANRLHIQVIPEIDMPGHSRAAIKSIHAKSQKSHRLAMKVDTFSIIDERDNGSFHSVQGFKGNTINPCMPETYKFVDRILTSLQQLHKDIQPLKVFHFGGDEVPVSSWLTSEACKKMAERQPDIGSHFGKMRYFVQKVSKATSDLGMSLGSWEDGVISYVKDPKKGDIGTPFLRQNFQNKEILVYVWKKPRVPWTPHRLRLLANYGYKIVLAYGSHFYFDHPYEADPEERGLYWAARRVSLEDTWGFDWKMSEGDIDLDCPKAVQDKTDCYKLKKPENIVGMQAQLWSETVRTSEQMEYMLFPRLIAVAERAWHKSSREGEDQTASNDRARQLAYAAFINLVGRKELSRLETLDIKYRIPPPGARVLNGRVTFRTEFPGLGVEYFVETERTWKDVSQNMPINGPLKIRTRSFDGRRFSRTVTVSPVKTP